LRRLSTSPDLQSEWNFRILASRQIIVKAKNDKIRKVSVIDVLTNAPLPLETPADFPMDALEVQKGYYATFKVYTLKSVKDVASDLVEFFAALDVDQSVEDFIKAYWLYPNNIRFELVEAEPL
jgi:hypothetical protein